MVPGYGTGRTRVPYPGEPTHKIHWYSCRSSACTHGQLYGVYTQPYRGTRALNLVPCCTAVLNLVWYTKFSVYSSTRVLNLVAVQWRNVARIRCIFIAMDVVFEVSTIILVRKFRDTAWIQIWEFLNSAILAHFLTHYHFSSEGRSRAISKSQWYYEYTPRELSNASTGTPYYRNFLRSCGI